MARAIVCTQGYTEDDSRATGTEDLYMRVLEKFTSPGSMTVYQPRRWKSSVKTLLSQLRRQNVDEVIYAAYSWGAGYTAPKFATLAPDYGIKIPLMLLCDPVYRPLWLPAWMGANPFCIRSLTKEPKILIPRSVSRVAWVRQNLNLPAGHDLKKEARWTDIADPIVLPYTHTTIDHSPEWFCLVKKEITKYLENETKIKTTSCT